MNKVFSCILIAAIVLSAAGCRNHRPDSLSEPAHQAEPAVIAKIMNRGKAEMSENSAPFRTEEIWCKNGSKNIYGVAYIPDTDQEKYPLVIFSHELGNSHTSGERYAERLAEAGYAVYTFDFCGGTVGGNKSDGANQEMSVLTEASDLEAVMEASKSWDFVDKDRIFLFGGSMGGLVTAFVGCSHQDEIAGMVLMYPALSAKEDGGMERYAAKDEVPEDVSLFGGWIHVGKNYILDLWDIDFYQLLASYQGHMLLLHGDRDRTVPISYSEKASEIIPDCEFHVISNGGHEFFGQPFEDAVACILPYLDGQLDEREEEREEGKSVMQMVIGDTPVAVNWEDNDSVSALKTLVSEKPLIIRMSMYGGFEQVGPIGQSLPRNDMQTVTNAGDIVLYSGNQIVVFYGSNSWAYTRLGKITDQSADQLKELLGRADVQIALFLGE